MKKTLFLVIVCFSISLLSTSLIFSKASRKNVNDWTIVPGTNVGPITKNTSEKKLVKIFGKENVVRKEIHSYEQSYLGTTVFNKTANELQIIWKTEKRESPKEIIFDSQNTQWHTNKNITIGTSLEFLEKINSKEIEINGFGWDYGGYIKSWGSGLLSKDHKIGKSLMIELSPDSKINPIKINDTVGEKGFVSGNPAIRILNLKISKIIILIY